MQDPRIPPVWWPTESEALLFGCALRFDGERLDKELAGRERLETYGALKRVYDTHYANSYELLEDDRLNFGVLFLLQRTQKWCDMLDPHERVLFLKLFLRLHDADVPAGYEIADWWRQYESDRHEARAQAEILRPLVARLESEIPLPDSVDY